MSTAVAIGGAVAGEALTWVGTPFRWQASVKGHGCDCKGLLWGVARSLGLQEAGSDYACAADYRRDRKVDTARLGEGMAALFDPVPAGEDLQPGDVCLVRVERAAQHLVIVTGPGRAVHADPASGVRERDLGALLRLRPLASAWRWRVRDGEAGK